MATQVKIATVTAVKKEYEARLGGGGGMIFADYCRLTVAEMTKLRRALRKERGSIKVLKNTLVRRALSELGGTELGAQVTPLLKGPTVVAYTPDEVTAPKVMVAFCKEIEADKNRKLVIKGGVLGGKLVSAAEIAQLAALPSREEVYAKLLALMNTPAQCLLRLMSEPGARAARLMKAISERTETPVN